MTIRLYSPAIARVSRTLSRICPAVPKPSPTAPLVALALGLFSLDRAHADYLVNFEDGDKPSYASRTVALNGLNWDLTEVLIGSDPADYKVGARSARFRGYATSVMTMLEDKPGGAGAISFTYRRYGSDAQQEWIVEVSANGGTSWTPVGDPFTATETVQTFTAAVAIPSPVRMRIRTLGSGTANRRMNLDDILITDFTGQDTTAPVATALLPKGPDVPVNTSLRITFSKPVAAGAGSVTLYRADGSVVQAFPAAGSLTDKTALFTPSAPLAHSAAYYVLVSGNAFADLDGRPFAGISDPTLWTFTTASQDLTGPVPAILLPANGAINVPRNLPFMSITFDEAVKVSETGAIRIIRNNGTSENPVYATVQILTADDVYIDDGSKEAFIFNSAFELGASYHVEVDAGFFVDLSGNGSAAFGGPATWSFRTGTVAPLGNGGAYTQRFASFTSVETLPAGWSVSGPVSGFPLDEAQRLWGQGINGGLRHGEDVLGYQHTGSTGEVAKVLTLRNDTGAPITSLTVSYVGRAARLAETRSPAYTVSLDTEPADETAGRIVIPQLGYSTAGGNGIARSASLTGLEIAPGALFQIRWTSDRDITASGSSKQIGISDVAVALGASSFPPTVAGLKIPLTGLGTASATAEAEVVADGGAAVTQRGFVFSAAESQAMPVIGGAGVTTVVAGEAGTGTYEALLENLNPLTSYTVRAFATNSIGTSYTNGLSFTTLAPVPEFTGFYSQPFNNFSGSLPAGWTAISSGNVQSYTGDWGTGTSGGFRGGVENPGVLGYQHVSTSGDLTVTLTLRNNTAAALTSLYVEYLGRAAVTNQPRHPAWAVSVDGGEPIEALAYSTAGGVDAKTSSQITGLNIPAGATFSIRWVSDRGTNTTGNSRQIGMGNVIVSTEAPSNTYGAWISRFEVGALTGPTDDPDNDGIPNAVENHFGTDPSATNRGIRLVSSQPGQVVLEHPISATVATDLTASYEWSTNLTAWNASGASVGGTTVNIAAVHSQGLATVTATASGTAAPRIFIRLNVR
jgi:hypothetical protein